MSDAINLVVARLASEEGFRSFAYDDATGQRVRAPKGNLTWLYGCNLETSGTPELGALVLAYQVRKVSDQLTSFTWYANLDEVRKSVCLDIAFNGGVGGLLHFPHMIAALARQDWATAKAECVVQNPELSGRYTKLGDILLSGVAA